MTRCLFPPLTRQAPRPWRPFQMGAAFSSGACDDTSRRRGRHGLGLAAWLLPPPPRSWATAPSATSALLPSQPIRVLTRLGAPEPHKPPTRTSLPNDLPRRTAHWPTLRVTLSVFGTQARGGWRCAAGLCIPGRCSADPCAADSRAADSRAGCPSAADSSAAGPCAGGSCAGDSCAGGSCADYMRVDTLGYTALHGEAFAGCSLTGGVLRCASCGHDMRDDDEARKRSFGE